MGVLEAELKAALYQSTTQPNVKGYVLDSEVGMLNAPN